jgi:hypothetical protein
MTKVRAFQVLVCVNGLWRKIRVTPAGGGLRDERTITRLPVRRGMRSQSSLPTIDHTPKAPGLVSR